MTKPSYEELLSLTNDVHALNKKLLDEQDADRAELLRVRGLLQRAQDLLSEARENLMAVHISGAISSGSNLAAMCGLNAQDITRFKELVRGAESADIGKLDSADKDENVLCAFCPMRSPDRTMKACLDAGKCLYADKPVGHFALAQRQIPRNATELAAMAIRGEFNDAENEASAETGGEKAAPASGPPECYCPENTACICRGNRNG